MKKVQRTIPKAITGIRGLDEITLGGLPKGRTALVCGDAGCGKTILSMEFLAHGAREFEEPGIFVSFEETPDELKKNFASLGYDLEQLEADQKLIIEYVFIERSEIEETGNYDLDGLFIRLGHAIDTIGAKRVVLDTLEVLFCGLKQEGIVRAELRRLFRWLKDRGVTAVVTAERGEKMLTRYGLEEYIADCVIILDLRVAHQIATRRVRIVKYRGSHHGTDEYPFLIDEHGISILPLTSLLLSHEASNEYVSSGIPRLDHMLSGRGYFRGSSILVSGTAGSGKSTLAAIFAAAAAQRKERCLYFAFEESPSQIIRNMRSIGLDLESAVKKKLLHFHASRPSTFGLEMHLVVMHKLIAEFQPQIVVLDPISNLVSVGSVLEAKSMLTRLIDYLKTKQITALFTDLSRGPQPLAGTTEEISSLIDTWVSLQDFESVGERNRGLHIIKSRGMSHSNQIRELIITDHGLNLLDVNAGPDGVLAGSARLAQQARQSAQLEDLERTQRNRQRDYQNHLLELQAELEAVQRQLAQVKSEMELDQSDGAANDERAAMDRNRMKSQRKGD